MTDSQRLTDKLVQNAKPLVGKSRTFILDTVIGEDATLPGSFGLRLTARGAKSWVAVCRVADPTGPDRRKQRYVTLGRYPALSLAEARERACDVLKEAGKGIDPVEVRAEEKRAKASIISVDQAIDEFIERYAKKHTRSWKETERVLETYALPKWKGRALPSITPADIHQILDPLTDDGKAYMANRLLATVRKFFNWCKQRQWIKDVPTEGIAPPGKEQARDRVLDWDELVDVWNAADQMGWPFGPFFRLLIVTGQRRSEVSNMKWDQIDLDGNLWTLPKEETKSDRLHQVPLSPMALEIINSLPKTSDLLFSTTGTTPISGFSRAKKEIDKLSEVTGWRIHDLRRTVASGMAENGIAPHVIEKVLNHSSGQISGIAAVYNRHAYLPEKEKALATWANALTAAIEGQTDNTYAS